MPVRKSGTSMPDSFDIDPVLDLDTCMEGIMGCLEGEGINCVGTEPETIIVIRSSQVNAAGDRLFAARVYPAGNIDKVTNDLLTGPRP